jgi:hypothetical protein
VFTGFFVTANDLRRPRFGLSFDDAVRAVLPTGGTPNGIWAEAYLYSIGGRSLPPGQWFNWLMAIVFAKKAIVPVCPAVAGSFG